MGSAQKSLPSVQDYDTVDKVALLDKVSKLENKGKGKLNTDTLMNHGSHLVIFTEASGKKIPLQGLSAMFCTNSYCRSLKVGIANMKNLVTCSYDLCTDSKCRKR